MITKTYDLKTQWKQLNEEIYDQYRKIARVMKVEKPKGQTGTRILQNKFTNQFIICIENVDFERNIAKIEINDSDEASEFAMDYLDNQVKRFNKLQDRIQEHKDQEKHKEKLMGFLDKLPETVSEGVKRYRTRERKLGTEKNDKNNK